MKDLYIVITLLSVALFIYDVVFLYSIVYNPWIKKKRLTVKFPEWEGTKKPFVWFLKWSLSFSFNIPLFIVISFICGSTAFILIPIVISCPIYTFAWVVIYFIVEGR